MKRILPILLVLLLLPVFTVSAGEEGKLITQGETGEEVVRIQARLFDLGYYTYKPTGSFQTVTKSAVMTYQASNGLMNDGSVGEETINELFSRSAKRVDFHAEIPLSFTAQGTIAQKGNRTPWEDVLPKLEKTKEYRIRNAETAEDIKLSFSSGTKHAEMRLPAAEKEKENASAMLTKWLGSTNSFYKSGVLFNLEGKWIAASIQWNGKDRICVYFKNSVSHVLNLPDAEHEANIEKVGK